jgi:hypothetical protein
MGRSIALLAVALLLGAPLVSAADLRLVDGVSGAPVTWSDWVSRRGPVALLVWASWTPDAASALAGFEGLAAACKDKGLRLVVLDVQETLEDGRSALSNHDGGWLHDRHGVLLKRYRVISVPSLLVVAADGGLLAKMEASPDAVRAWSGP